MTSQPLLPRFLERSLSKAIHIFPTTVITGARQTGKSTLTRNALPLDGYRYVTLDNAVTRGMAQAEPYPFLTQAERLIVDEVQRAPELLLVIKEVVDTRQQAGQFILTGSANLLLMHHVAESLAGRARYLNLWPMTRREQLGMGETGIWGELFAQPRSRWPELIGSQAAPRDDWRELARRGGYPKPSLAFPGPEDDDSRNEIFAGYTQTYLERDLRDLSAIDNLYDFQRLMRAVCLRLGNIVHQTDLAITTGLSRTTVQRYLNLLEISYQLIRIEPYAVNRTKRLTKSPKYYWSDTGLALYLAGGVEPTGAHLENIVFGDLLAWREGESTRPNILYWRTAAGEEVDIVIEWKGRLMAVEVKATTHPSYKDARHLRTFLSEYGDEVVGGILMHAGEETFWISEGVLAVPWWGVI